MTKTASFVLNSSREARRVRARNKESFVKNFRFLVPVAVAAMLLSASSASAQATTTTTTPTFEFSASYQLFRLGQV